MDFNHLRGGSVITTSNESTCTLWLNSSFKVTYDEDIHLVTAGKVYLHDKLIRELELRENEETLFSRHFELCIIIFHQRPKILAVMYAP